ncbi:MAG: MoxR family ATPase, partial [Pseudomonadota bacterium]
LQILKINRNEARQATNGSFTPAEVVSKDTINAARAEILDLHLAPELERYIVQLVMATRAPETINPALADAIQFGASPRASIAIDRTARAHAWLAGRNFVAPDDIQAVAPDVLRHRMLLSFEAEANGMTTNDLINEIIGGVGVP